MANGNTSAGRGQHPGARLAAILVAATILPVGSAAAITGCDDDAGRRTYTQFGCPPGTTATSRPPEGVLSVVPPAPLTPAEQRALERLERQLARDRQQRRADRERTHRARAAARAEARARCADAEQALADLAAKRRQGYTAREARKLDRQQERWQAIRRSAC